MKHRCTALVSYRIVINTITRRCIPARSHTAHPLPATAHVIHVGFRRWKSPLTPRWSPGNRVHLAQDVTIMRFGAEHKPQYVRATFCTKASDPPLARYHIHIDNLSPYYPPTLLRGAHSGCTRVLGLVTGNRFIRHHRNDITTAIFQTLYLQWIHLELTIGNVYLVSYSSICIGKKNWTFTTYNNVCNQIYKYASRVYLHLPKIIIYNFCTMFILCCKMNESIRLILCAIWTISVHRLIYHVRVHFITITNNYSFNLRYINLFHSFKQCIEWYHSTFFFFWCVVTTCR